MNGLNLTWSAVAVALAVITVALAVWDAGRAGIRKPSPTGGKTAAPLEPGPAKAGPLDIVATSSDWLIS